AGTGLRPVDRWWLEARSVLLAGKMQVTYFASEGPRIIEPHQFPYLEFILDLQGGPYLYWKNPGALSRDRLHGVRVKAVDVVAAFPMQTPALAARKVGPDGGRPSSMPAIEAKLDRLIAGGTKVILEFIRQWASMTRDTRSKGRLA